jgi:hypothetical protein
MSVAALVFAAAVLQAGSPAGPVECVPGRCRTHPTRKAWQVTDPRGRSLLLQAQKWVGGRAELSPGGNRTVRNRLL